VDARTRVLVLGSLPGEASLAASRYYAHPQNGFWRLMGTVIGENLAGMEYEDRLATLLAHGVGLWDVIQEASREGSLDASIRDHSGNDLKALVATLPALRAVAFNGGTSAKIGRKLLGDATGLDLVALPSSSPAYTLAFSAKAEAWSALKSYLAD
jgi:hypoxanthine-DNA glycosylase